MEADVFADSTEPMESESMKSLEETRQVDDALTAFVVLSHVHSWE